MKGGGVSPWLSAQDIEYLENGGLRVPHPL